jgi:hypothetical protein
LLGTVFQRFFQPRRGSLLPLAGTPPGAPGHPFQAVDPRQLLGPGGVDVDDGRCQPFLLERLHILGDTLLRHAELAADFPLTQAAQVHVLVIVRTLVLQERLREEHAGGVQCRSGFLRHPCCRPFLS